MLINWMVQILSWCMCISDHYDVYFKHLVILLGNCTSIKLSACPAPNICEGIKWGKEKKKSEGNRKVTEVAPYGVKESTSQKERRLQ